MNMCSIHILVITMLVRHFHFETFPKNYLTFYHSKKKSSFFISLAYAFLYKNKIKRQIMFIKMKFIVNLVVL